MAKFITPFVDFLKNLKIYFWAITVVITVATVVYAVYNTITNTPKEINRMNEVISSLDTRTTSLEVKAQIQQAAFSDLKQQITDNNADTKAQLNVIQSDIKYILKKM